MAISMQLSLVGVLTQTFRTLKKDFCNTYRPELHYMRGPGPKWFEKHAMPLDPIPARLHPARISASPPLRRPAGPVLRGVPRAPRPH